jgi:ribosomal protein S18 acetylase RimI-like enzyme
MREFGWAALWDFQIDRAYRGIGLGSYLLDRALRIMREEGYGEVELHTNTYRNALALEMYRKRGFSVSRRWISMEKPWPAAIGG